MKRICFTLSVMLSLHLLSQNFRDTVFVENFDNNNYKWWTGKSQDIQAEIKDGCLILKHPGKNGYALWHNYFLDFSKDFEIETKIKMENSEDINYSFGLVWGVENWDNRHSLVITGNQFYCISNNLSGSYKEMVAYTEDKNNILPNGNYNILKVAKSGNTLSYYINGTQIYNEKYNYPVSGNNIGFIMFENKTLRIDYLKIKGNLALINLVKDAVKGYKKENLGTSVNSSAYELWPVISADGKTLFIDRENHPKNTSKNQDIWISTRNQDGSWTNAVNAGYPLNNYAHNFVFSVSADNNSIMVGHVYNSDGSFKESGISEARKNAAGGWDLPQKVTVDDFYNESGNNEFYLSADGNFLLMAIKRKDTKGGNDVYVSFKKKDRHYSKPLNLGSTINSAGGELSPFLSPDNKTLYFASDKWPGYGSADIFVSRRLDDTWQNWTQPQNLGPEINTAGWDAYFTVPASGTEAYLVSDENSIGNNDIFRIPLVEAAKPEPVVLIKGRVLNKKTNEPLEALISYDDITNAKKVGTARSNPKTGEYSIILPLGKNYSYMAEKENFYAITDNINIVSLTEYKEITRDLYLVPVEIGQTIRLNNIFFEFDKADLKSESNEELNRLCEFLSNNKKVKIEISGHTDNKGDDAYNQKLSQKRVESVSAYLVSKGISQNQFTVKGVGESKPVATNDTDEGRALNRRVEFTIIEK